MKKIGIIGGVAWPSTVEYYRLICTWANEHFAAEGMTEPLPTPPMVIESLVMAETRALRGVQGNEESWAAYDNVIRDALLRLEAAGCEVGVIANNTFHTRLHAIKRGLGMEIISIIDASADAARDMGAKQALVLGTGVTMRASSYAEALLARGVTPNGILNTNVIDGMQSMIDTEFHGAKVTDAGRRDLLQVCRDHVDNPRNTVVLLACTELPLAFSDHLDDPVFTSEGFKFVNTSAVHARATLNASLGI